MPVNCALKGSKNHIVCDDGDDASKRFDELSKFEVFTDLEWGFAKKWCFNAWDLQWLTLLDAKWLDRDHSLDALDALERLGWNYSIAVANLEFTNWKQSTEEISLGSHCAVNGGHKGQESQESKSTRTSVNFASWISWIIWMKDLVHDVYDVHVEQRLWRSISDRISDRSIVVHCSQRSLWFLVTPVKFGHEIMGTSQVPTISGIQQPGRFSILSRAFSKALPFRMRWNKAKRHSTSFNVYD